MAVSTVSIEVDHAANAAYMQLSDQEVARTVEVSETIWVDLDRFDMVVGIEILSLRKPQIPLTDLSSDYHIPSRALEVVRKNLSRIMTFVSSSSAVSTSFASGVRNIEGLQYT